MTENIENITYKGHFSYWMTRECLVPYLMGDHEGVIMPEYLYVRNDGKYEVIDMRWAIFRFFNGQKNQRTKCLKIKGPSAMYPKQVAKLTLELGDVDDFPDHAVSIIEENNRQYIRYDLDVMNLKIVLTATEVVR